MFKGIIVENSLEDHNLFRTLTIEKTWQEGDWTLHQVSASYSQLADLGRCLEEGPWYMHFWEPETDEIVVLFKTRTFRGKRSDASSLKEAVEHGRSLGIPEEQLDFSVM